MSEVGEVKAAWMNRTRVYRGLNMRCSPGLHERGLEMLIRNGAPKSGILDLAAGTGAWIARLEDAEFRDISAIERNTAEFGLPSIKPLDLNLDEDFASHMGRKFNLVTALEIIEHLENPFHFLREIRMLLEPGGWLLFSTPNVSSWHGRLKFLALGQLRGFDERNFYSQRHISPLTEAQIRPLLQETGFDMIERVTAGEFYGWGKLALLSPLWVPLCAWAGRSAWGDAGVHICRAR